MEYCNRCKYQDKSKHKEAMEKIKRWDDEVITWRLS